ncbi:MAG: hypothetical protein ACRC3B_06245, partial [Bacteroidia bacterium]
MKLLNLMGLICGLLIGSTAFAQNKQTIIIRDRATLTPVSDVVVEIHAQPVEGTSNARTWQAAGTTNATGQVIVRISPDCDSMRFTHPGYGTQLSTAAAVLNNGGQFLINQRAVLL